MLLCHRGGNEAEYLHDSYLGGAQPCLQLSALLLQGSDLFVLGQQSVGVVGEVPSSLTGKCSLVLFHRAGSHQGRGIDLHKSERVKSGMDGYDKSASVSIRRNLERLVT